MDKLAQVTGILQALRSIATQANYTDVYKGMEAQCISTYRKCVDLLLTVEGYEEVETIAPELKDSANMKEIGFAVELLLSIVKSGQGEPVVPRFNLHLPHLNRSLRVWRTGRPPRPPRPPRLAPAQAAESRWSHHYGGEGRDDLRDELEREMEEKIDQEQERFENQVEEIEDKIEELRDKIDELRDALEDRLDEIRDEYEEKFEELEEAAEEEEEDEPEKDDEDRPSVDDEDLPDEPNG